MKHILGKCVECRGVGEIGVVAGVSDVLLEDVTETWEVVCKECRVPFPRLVVPERGVSGLLRWVGGVKGTVARFINDPGILRFQVERG